MNKIYFIFLCIFIFHIFMLAQTPQPEYGWKHSLVAGLTLTQVAFTDWTQGGENALSYTISSDGKSVDDEDIMNWATNYKFAFGQTRLGDQGIRKTDDIIDISTVFTYKLGTYINPYTAATMKTQFAKGFIYPAAGVDSAVSKFFDPVYLIQSIGVGYQPSKEIKTRLGVGLREIIADRFAKLYTDDPTTTDKIERVTVNGGIECVTSIEWQLEDNILFTSQLELFDPFKTLDQIIVRDNSTIIAKVSKYVSANVNLQLINERKITPRTQVKETIALGLSYALY